MARGGGITVSNGLLFGTRSPGTVEKANQRQKDHLQQRCRDDLALMMQVAIDTGEWDFAPVKSALSLKILPEAEVNTVITAIFALRRSRYGNKDNDTFKMFWPGNRQAELAADYKHLFLEPFGDRDVLDQITNDSYIACLVEADKEEAIAAIQIDRWRPQYRANRAADFIKAAQQQLTEQQRDDLLEAIALVTAESIEIPKAKKRNEPFPKLNTIRQEFDSLGSEMLETKMSKTIAFIKAEFEKAQLDDLLVLIGDDIDKIRRKEAMVRRFIEETQSKALLVFSDS